MADSAFLTELYEKQHGVVSKFFPPSKLDEVTDVELDAEDVLLSSGFKSGTTWTQQILHGLRSRGDMDFEDIHDVIPYLESATIRSEDFAASGHHFRPRIYETNRGYGNCPTGVRTVVVTRDPCAAALSLFRYAEGWWFERGEVKLDDFLRIRYGFDIPGHLDSFRAGQMRHLASWYPHRKDDNVLWLHYEDLKADLPQCIRLLAGFIGVDTDDRELMETVEQQASLEFMKAHVSKFDSHSMKMARNEVAGLRKDAGIGRDATGKVRTGQVKEYEAVFSAQTKAFMLQKWRELLQPVTGFASYDAMRAAVNAELGRSYPQ